VLTYGLNHLYRGHVARLQGDEAAARQAYAGIFSEEQLGLARYELDLIAEQQPSRQAALQAFADQLRRQTADQLAPGHGEAAARYADYYYARNHTDRAFAREAWSEAYRWSSESLNSIADAMRDTAARFQTYDLYTRRLDAYLGQSYYELFAGLRDTAAFSRAIEYASEAQAYVEKWFPYYTAVEYFKTNLAHGYALRNAPGDRERALETYRSFITAAADRGTARQVLLKDFRDLQHAGLRFAGMDEILTTVNEE
jgi:tetratricopeptide (TPR) repeat protein